jgi:hypothetical protein
VLEPVEPADGKAPHPRLRERLKRRVGGWIVRRLQKRVEREWREYDHSPKVSLGPWSRRRSEQGGTQVYRSLVQIHFHPRNRASH